MRQLAEALGVTVDWLLDATGARDATPAALLENPRTPQGLRDLAQDRVRAAILEIQPAEWQALRSLALPGTATKDGYTALLLTIRLVCGGRPPHTDEYYSVELVRDLFGDWTVIQSWGGVGSTRGRVRIVWVPSRDAGVARLAAIGKRRGKRGLRPSAERVGRSGARHRHDKEKTVSTLPRHPQRFLPAHHAPTTGNQFWRG